MLILTAFLCSRLTPWQIIKTVLRRLAQKSQFSSTALARRGNQVKGHSSQKFFCWVFSPKFLTDLKTNQIRPVGRAVTRSSLESEVRGSNLGPVKSDTVLPTARHRYDISSKGAVLPGRNDAGMGPTNSLHAGVIQRV